MTLREMAANAAYEALCQDPKCTNDACASRLKAAAAAIERVANEHASLLLRDAIIRGDVKLAMGPVQIAPTEMQNLLRYTYEKGVADGRMERTP